MRQYGDLQSVVATALMLALAAYLALYPAFFALILQRLVARFGVRAIVLAPAVWVTTEFGRGYLFTGFPWVSLGYSQATVLPVAQLASVCGVWGLSALVALVSAALALLVFDRTRLRWWMAAAAAIAVLVTSAWGSARLRDSALTREGVPLRVGLVQGNVSQDQKWNQARAAIHRSGLHRPDAGRAGRGGRALHPLARIGPPVLLRGGAARRRRGKAGGGRDRHDAPLRQRPDREDRARRATSTPRS